MDTRIGVEPDECYANIDMPACRVCEAKPQQAVVGWRRTDPGEEWSTIERFALLAPCGHLLAGAAAVEFREGIPAHYRLD